MRYPKERKEASRRKLVRESGRAFRKQGYGLIGVDGLAKGADMTSGGFYGHFDSKKEAFLEAVREGLEELRSGIAQTRDTGGARWRGEFARFYLGPKRTCDLADGCALPSLSADIERAGDDARKVYQEKLLEIVAELRRGAEGAGSREAEDAWADLALLLGGLTLARTVLDPALSQQIAGAVLSKFDSPTQGPPTSAPPA